MITSSGRRVKRRNMDERDGSTLKTHRKRRSRHRRLAPRKKTPKSKAIHPQRRSAQNALGFLSKLTGGSSDEDDVDLESSSSESDSEFPYSNTQSIESERSMQNNEMKSQVQRMPSKMSVKMLLNLLSWKFKQILEGDLSLSSHVAIQNQLFRQKIQDLNTLSRKQR